MPETSAPPVSIGAALSHGWRQLRSNFWRLLLAGIVVVVISGGTAWLLSGILGVGLVGANGTWYSSASLKTDLQMIYSGAVFGYILILLLAQCLFYNHLYAGFAGELLSAARGERVEVGGVFRAFGNYGTVALGLALPFLAFVVAGAVAVFLATVGGTLGYVLFIVYGIAAVIVACKLAFLPFLLVERRMKALEAIRESWRMTRGHAGEIFVIWLPMLVYVIVVYGIMLVAVIAVVSMAYAMVPSTLTSFVGALLFVLVLGVFGVLGSGIMTMWLGTATAWLYDAVLRRRGPELIAADPTTGAAGLPEA